MFDFSIHHNGAMGRTLDISTSDHKYIYRGLTTHKMDFTLDVLLDNLREGGCLPSKWIRDPENERTKH